MRDTRIREHGIPTPQHDRLLEALGPTRCPHGGHLERAICLVERMGEADVEAVRVWADYIRLREPTLRVREEPDGAWHVIHAAVEPAVACWGASRIFFGIDRAHQSLCRWLGVDPRGEWSTVGRCRTDAPSGRRRLARTLTLLRGRYEEYCHRVWSHDVAAAIAEMLRSEVWRITDPTTGSSWLALSLTDHLRTIRPADLVDYPGEECSAAPLTTAARTTARVLRHDAETALETLRPILLATPSLPSPKGRYGWAHELLDSAARHRFPDSSCPVNMLLADIHASPGGIVRLISEDDELRQHYQTITTAPVLTRIYSRDIHPAVGARRTP